MEATGCVRLWGRGQRYVLTELLFDHGPLRVAEIVALLHDQGLVVGGRPSKTVSDALRWEVAHGRVVRLGRGLYGPGRMPRSTRAWIRRRNRLLRAQRVCPLGLLAASVVGGPPGDRALLDGPPAAPAGAATRAGRAGRAKRAAGRRRPDRTDVVIVEGAGWSEAEEAAADAAQRRTLLDQLGWSGP